MLISLSLFAIVVFQLYWTVNAYRINKKNLNAKIDIAMQQAMDSCKKDYFDSIRIVLVRRLSDPSVKIRIDTVPTTDTAHALLHFYISGKQAALRTPITLNKTQFNFYRTYIHHKATIPEVFTEMSFYLPGIVSYINLILGPEDNSREKFLQYLRAHPHMPSDSVIKNTHFNLSISKLPPHYIKADSLRLLRYFTRTLANNGINAPFYLKLSHSPDTVNSTDNSYSKTASYEYKYHGFKVFGLSALDPALFVQGIFYHPGYAVLKDMLIILILSALLIILTSLCFAYTIRIILQQKKLADLKDDFINNMTHELKTPIATITVAIEGLQKFNALNNPEKTQRYLQTSQNELSRLNTLVSQVLNLATFEHKNIDMVKVQIDLDELMFELIELEKAKTNKIINITYQNKDGIKYLYADRLHFGNTIANLLDNAIKYSGNTVDIRISCYQNGNNLCVTVSDNGIGISQANIHLVFDKFYRVPTGNVHNVKGTGIGLSYAKYVAEAHGGSISVESEMGNGTEFIVCLPLNNG